MYANTLVLHTANAFSKILHTETGTEEKKVLYIGTHTEAGALKKIQRLVQKKKKHSTQELIQKLGPLRALKKIH